MILAIGRQSIENLDSQEAYEMVFKRAPFLHSYSRLCCSFVGRASRVESRGIARNFGNRCPCPAYLHRFIFNSIYVASAKRRCAEVKGRSGFAALNKMPNIFGNTYRCKHDFARAAPRSGQLLGLTPKPANRAPYSSVRPVVSLSCSYRLAGGKGGSQESRRMVQSS